MSLTLHDLLARGMHVEWFEAVAIVQALCARLLHDPPGGGRSCARPARDRHHRRRRPSTSPAKARPTSRRSSASGQVLSALVAHQQMPVPLRLVALTAVSPSPPYASIGDLSSALDYYERPDRAAVVRAVYERYQACRLPLMRRRPSKRSPQRHRRPRPPQPFLVEAPLAARRGGRGARGSRGRGRVVASASSQGAVGGRRLARGCAPRRRDHCERRRSRVFGHRRRPRAAWRNERR